MLYQLSYISPVLQTTKPTTLFARLELMTGMKNGTGDSSNFSRLRRGAYQGSALPTELHQPFTTAKTEHNNSEKRAKNEQERAKNEQERAQKPLNLAGVLRCFVVAFGCCGERDTKGEAA